jgi:hypothetical protein
MSRVPLLVELTVVLYVQTPSSLPQNLCNLIDTNVCYIIDTIWVDFDCESHCQVQDHPYCHWFAVTKPCGHKKFEYSFCICTKMSFMTYMTSH